MDHFHSLVEEESSSNEFDVLFQFDEAFLLPNSVPLSFAIPFADPRLEPRHLAKNAVLNGSPEDTSTSSMNCLIEKAVDTANRTSRNPAKYQQKRHAPLHDDYQCQVNKRARLSIVAHRDESISRFSQHQDALWREQLVKLVQFKEQFGHCGIPISFSQDMTLARWVKRQRYQYKKYHQGKVCAINASRMQSLESIGFVWDAHSAAWQEKFGELTLYKQAFGHCDVPSFDVNNVQLSTWVKCQRRQYKLRIAGKSSNMTASRIQELDSLGFLWSVRARIEKP